jgi:hypothetical protein
MSKWLAQSIFAIAGILLMCGVQASEPYKPKYLSNPAQICVERFEDEGVINIVPVTVIISQNSKITLVGGEAACLVLPGGPESISLSFPYPYDDHQTPQMWTTAARNFEVKGGSVVSFELCEAADQQVNDPHWAANGWHNMWLLRQVGESPAHRCAAER